MMKSPAIIAAFSFPAILSLGLAGGAVHAAEPKAAAAAKPPVLSCTTAGADGLTYTIVKPGKGEKPSAESKVKVNYKGHLKSDGTKFDEGQGIEFKVTGVIKGFAQGLQLMQPGGTYRFCIPAALGYGANGSGSIPANADLVFEVDLLSFINPPPMPVIPADQRACTQITASGLGYTVIKSGTGRALTDKDMALVDVTPFDPKTGVTKDKDQWTKIPLSQANPVFAEALKMMQAGASYRFCLPPNPAAPGAEVNAIIDLIDVRVAPVPF